MDSIPMTSHFAIRRIFNTHWKLTILGRSLLLISLELLFCAACWTICAILFARREETRGMLSLALLAWTIGLRHGLDADHISAIDNATRGLISLGQLPVTCGLYFSMGHSTIVIIVNVAIAISTSVYDHIGGVGNVGGIIGAAVSGSFLFIIGLANSVILYRIIRNRRRRARLANQSSIEAGSQQLSDDPNYDAKSEKTIMMRILGPVTKFVNRPWKMYPVGVLFGLGFDTASSIALLAVSALAIKDADGKHIPQGYIVILPFLFTAGMSLVDSADSVLMLYSYAGFPERSWAIFEKRDGIAITTNSISETTDSRTPVMNCATVVTEIPTLEQSPGDSTDIAERNADRDVPSASSPKTSIEAECIPPSDEEKKRLLLVKQHTMSNLSVILTLISILVAFSISLITIMGLIGDNCAPCRDAADAPDGGGLAGRWWRAWAKANDESGFIGAAIVGGFVAVVVTWYCVLWVMSKVRARGVRVQHS
ncbi:NicO-domain-containing protein [Rickenella mellea]|uniref:Nickel/cobalt efflux system n=1 Tax=Rickenella mellea TaxID=50990 RepID=A0A4Y7Q7X2_9AGAM|nr:NicO-domain-containing protein [Rickenella mellea]